MNCNNINPDFVTTFPTAGAVGTTPALTPPPGYAGIANCYSDGEASLAVKRELAQGPVITSLVGYTLSYNSLDNNKNPTKGILADFRQDFAGVGGDVNFVRTGSDVYAYHEVVPDVIGLLHLQGGHITGWGGKGLRMLDHFQMGPSLVRGFAPAGIGPRDLTVGTTNDALGGTMYWGASLELQTPLYFLPKDAGVKVAAFADAGSLWNYVGPTTFPATGEVLSGSICATPPCPVDNAMHIRSSVGVGTDLGFAVRAASLRLLVPADEGILRPRAAVPLRWRHEILTPAAGRRLDGMTEPFFFDRGRGLTVREIAALIGAEPRAGADLDRRITGIASLDRAAPNDLAFLDKPKYRASIGGERRRRLPDDAALRRPRAGSHQRALRTRALSCFRGGHARPVSGRTAALLPVRGGGRGRGRLRASDRAPGERRHRRPGCGDRPARRDRSRHR